MFLLFLGDKAWTISKKYFNENVEHFNYSFLII